MWKLTMVRWMQMLGMTSTRGQYQLKAFVCDGACVRYAPKHLGTMSFQNIYTSRPNNCRYAVATYWSPVDGRDIVKVWDLYDAWRMPDMSIVEPAPKLVHTSTNAAIAATLLLYDDVGGGK